MSDQFNDFEKVDPEPYQDENVTSTSMTGDMAEEDRYTDGSSAQNDIDMFSSGGGSNTDFTEPKPLISFEPSVEPTAPPMEAESSVSGAKPVDGNWMKNVDPRDNSFEEDMADKSEAIPVEPQAQSDLGVIQFTGDKQLATYKEEEGASEKELESESSEYGSSGDESDTETSDIETSDDASDNNIVSQNSSEQKDHCQGEISLSEQFRDNVNQWKNSVRSETRNEKSDSVKLDIKFETNMDTLSEGPDLVVMGDQKVSDTNTLESLKQDCSDIKTKQFNESNTRDRESELPEQSAELKGNEAHAFDQDKEEISSDNKVDGHVINIEGMNKTDEYEISKDIQRRIDEDDTVIQEMHREGEEINSNMNTLPSFGISEMELSDVLDKLTNDEDIVDSISPVVSDYEKEIDTCKNEMLRESSGSPEMMSEDSGSCSDNDSVDSDISGDEEVCGTWNPSPLYEFTREEGDEGEEANMSDENEGAATDNDYTLTGHLDTSAPLQMSVESDNNLNELREDVKGLMEEMESLVKQGQEDVHYFEDSDPDLESSNIEVVGTACTTQSSIKQSDRSKLKLNSDTNEPDMLHVHFHSPTNTLFYDPESPIVERVSEEVQHELIDYDDEAKDVENEKETCNVIVQAELQAEVVKDLKDVYEKLEAYKESGKESTDDTKEYIPIEKENETKKPPDLSTFSLYKRKEEKESEPEEEEVVLRRKNDLNTDAASHRSQRISEVECDSMIIHDLKPVLSSYAPEEHVEGAMELVESSDKLETIPDNLNENRTPESDDPTEMKSSTESMIIHDDDALKTLDNLLESPVSEDDKMEPLTEESKSVSVNPVVNKLASDLVEQIFKEADKVVEKIQYDSSLADHATCDEAVTKTSELDFDKNVCESIDEGVDESVPFNDSLNNTVIETDAIENELVSEISKQENVVEGFDRTNESEPSEVILTNNHKENEKELDSKTEKPDGQQETMEMILLILKQEDHGKSDQHHGKIMEISWNFVEEVLELIYWRDVKKTGVVFGSMMFILLSLSICSIMSVLAYLSLAILTVTMSFRVYKNVMQAVQKTNEGHPFKNLLDMDIALQEDVVKNAADKIAQNINNCAKELRRLYLVEDYVDTLKFGLMLWLMTYIGAWFDGMTLVILVVISIFTLPKVYETYKVPIDQNVNLVRAQLNNIMAQVSAKLPFPKKKAKTQ